MTMSTDMARLSRNTDKFRKQCDNMIQFSVQLVGSRKDRISERKVQFGDIFLILECNVKCDCGYMYVCVCRQLENHIARCDRSKRSARIDDQLSYSRCNSALFVHEKRRRYDVQSTSFFYFLRPTSRSSRVLSAAPTLYLIAISKGKRDLSPHER